MAMKAGKNLFKFDTRSLTWIFLIEIIRIFFLICNWKYEVSNSHESLPAHHRTFKRIFLNLPDFLWGRTQTTWPFLGHFLTPLPPPRDMSWFFEGPLPPKCHVFFVNFLEYYCTQISVTDSSWKMCLLRNFYFSVKQIYNLKIFKQVNSKTHLI